MPNYTLFKHFEEILKVFVCLFIVYTYMHMSVEVREQIVGVSSLYQPTSSFQAVSCT